MILQCLFYHALAYAIFKFINSKWRLPSFVNPSPCTVLLLQCFFLAVTCTYWGSGNVRFFQLNGVSALFSAIFELFGRGFYGNTYISVLLTALVTVYTLAHGSSSTVLWCSYLHTLWMIHSWILSCPGVHKTKEIRLLQSMEYSLPVSGTHAGNKRSI